MTKQEKEQARLERIKKYQSDGLPSGVIIEKIKEDFTLRDAEYTIKAYNADIEKMVAEWRNFRDQTADFHQMQDYYRLEQIIQLCWRRFQETQEKRTTKKTIRDGDGNLLRIEVTDNPPAVDTRMITIIMELMKRQSEIRGSVASYGVKGEIGDNEVDMKKIRQLISKNKPITDDDMAEIIDVTPENE